MQLTDTPPGPPGPRPINDNSTLTAYYTYSEQTLKVSHSTGYIADLRDQNNTM